MKEFRSITELINAFPTEQSCIDYLASIRWEGSVKDKRLLWKQL